MKRIVLVNIPALTIVMRENSWEYAKYFAILLVSAVITVGCDKAIVEDDNNARLKRISSIYLGFSSEVEFSYKTFITNPETIWYVASEYEYDNLGRISKISRPMYDNGNINGVISYDTYTYNKKANWKKS